MAFLNVFVEYSATRYSGCGLYWNQQGEFIAEVKEGKGTKPVFGSKGIKEIQEYQNGVAEGKTKVFDEKGKLKKEYNLFEGLKHGECVEYYPTLSSEGDTFLQPMLSVYWQKGKIQGLTRTWYPNGNLENQREMACNKKNGVTMAWYRDGQLMLLEEYEDNKLLKGDYVKKNDRKPVSQVVNGRGLATIFDAEGHFVEKIVYEYGRPDS